MRIPPFDTDRVSAEDVFAPVDVHGEFRLQRSLRHIDLGNLVTVRRVDEYLPVGYVNVPTHVHGHALASSLPESKRTIRMLVGLKRNNAIPESPRIDKKHSLAFIDGRGVKPTFPRPHQIQTPLRRLRSVNRIVVPSEKPKGASTRIGRSRTEQLEIEVNCPQQLVAEPDIDG